VVALDEVVGAEAAPTRFLTLLFAIFGGLAILLSGMGLFAVLLANATRGRRQIAMRLALGAEPKQIAFGVLRNGLRLVGIGVTAGLVVAAVLSPSLQGLLFQVSALDPLSYVAAGALMALVALVACILPGFRAARVDPAEILREE
jgi:putative ABC transport system permease protein